MRQANSTIDLQIWPAALFIHTEPTVVAQSTPPFLLYYYIITDLVQLLSQKYLEFNRLSRLNPLYSDTRLHLIQTRVHLLTQAESLVGSLLKV